MPGETIPLAGGGSLQLAGIGPERARMAAASLVASGADSLLSWGLAAGLDATLGAGVLIVPRTVVFADGRHFAVAEPWHARVQARLPDALPCCAGALAEATRVLTSPREKSELGKVTGAVAADMESASVARVAETEGIPFLAVRAITDPAWLQIPGWASQALDGDGKVRRWQTVRALLRHPWELGRLMVLARGFSSARVSLTSAAEPVINAF